MYYTTNLRQTATVFRKKIKFYLHLIDFFPGFRYDSSIIFYLQTGGTQMPAEFTDFLNNSIGGISLGDIVAAVITLILCLVVVRFVRKILQKMLSKSRLDKRAQKYIISGIKIVLYLLTAIIVVSKLGIDLSSLVALLSVVTLGITLAAEDILANIAGGLVILSSHPFTIGDIIEADGASGTVEEISLNYTKLITGDGQLVLLPNKTLADSKMVNYTVLGRRRSTHLITASYDAPTDTVKAACEKALAMTEGILTDPPTEVYLTSFGASSIEYMVRCWTPVDDYWPIHCKLAENIRTTFAEFGVEMTYNHLNVHVLDEKRV